MVITNEWSNNTMLLQQMCERTEQLREGMLLNGRKKDRVNSTFVETTIYLNIIEKQNNLLWKQNQSWPLTTGVMFRIFFFSSVMLFLLKISVFC